MILATGTTHLSGRTPPQTFRLPPRLERTQVLLRPLEQHCPHRLWLPGCLVEGVHFHLSNHSNHRSSRRVILATGTTHLAGRTPPRTFRLPSWLGRTQVLRRPLEQHCTHRLWLPGCLVEGVHFHLSNHSNHRSSRRMILATGTTHLAGRLVTRTLICHPTTPAHASPTMPPRT